MTCNLELATDGQHLELQISWARGEIIVKYGNPQEGLDKLPFSILCRDEKESIKIKELSDSLYLVAQQLVQVYCKFESPENTDKLNSQLLFEQSFFDYKKYINKFNNENFGNKINEQNQFEKWSWHIPWGNYLSS